MAELCMAGTRLAGPAMHCLAWGRYLALLLAHAGEIMTAAHEGLSVASRQEAGREPFQHIFAVPTAGSRE